jgi:hypothetical protein
MPLSTLNLPSTTVEKYFAPGGKAVDNIFSRTAALSWLRNKAKLDAQDGERARHPVIGAKNNTFGSYADYDQVITDPAADPDLFNVAEYLWKQAKISIPMSGIEKAKNGGDSAVVKLLAGKIENAEITAAEGFEQWFLTGDGTGNSNKDWAGLPVMIGTTVNTTDAGGINATTNSWWRSYVQNNGGVDTVLTLGALARAYNSVSFGADKCDFEITTQTLYEAYEALLLPQQRFASPEVGKAGFDSLVHKGGVVVWSDLMTGTAAKTWFFLNSRHIKLSVLDGEWMKFSGWVRPYDRDAEYAIITSYGCFATNGRRYLGRVNNLIPA